MQQITGQSGSGMVGMHIGATGVSEAESRAVIGISWYNGLDETDRKFWHAIAGSAVPFDAWVAYCEVVAEPAAGAGAAGGKRSAPAARAPKAHPVGNHGDNSNSIGRAL